MNRLEYLAVFDADGGKLIDIKEAAPVDFVIGRAPPHQSVVLAFEYFVQALFSVRRNRIEVIIQTSFNGSGAFSGERKTMIKIPDEDPSIFLVHGYFGCI